MEVIENSKVIISKEELDVLLMAASMLCVEGKNDTEIDLELTHAANVSIVIEEHIWGNNKIPEEILLQTKDLIAREEMRKGDHQNGK